MKRLIYIDQLVGPTSLDIINALSKYYEVHLYCGSIIHTYAGIDERVIYHKRTPYNKRTLFLRLYSWFAFYFVTVFAVFFRQRKHTFFLVSNPPLNFFLGHLLSRIFRVPFNLLMFDIYPDIIVQSKYLSSGSALVKFWSYLNKLSFRKAHRIFTISENLAKEVSKYEPQGSANIVVVSNWVDTDEIKPLPKSENPFIQTNDLANKMIVMYSGNMGKTHDIETIVETARLLTDYPDIHFLLIGDGEKRPGIGKMVVDYKLKNISLLPFQPPEVFKYSIACADIGFVTLSDGFERYSVPSKTYYLMAAGCIVFAIAHRDSEMENIINTYQCGFRFDPGSASAIAARIVELYSDKQQMKMIGHNARLAAANFTMANAEIIADGVRSE